MVPPIAPYGQTEAYPTTTLALNSCPKINSYPAQQICCLSHVMVPPFPSPHNCLGATLLLQAILNVDLLIAATTAGLQEENGSSLIPQWRLTLQKEFGISLRHSRQLLCKIQNLSRRYLSERLPGVQPTSVRSSGQLPSVSLDLRTWLSLPDAKRLTYMSKMLPFYQGLVQQLRDHEATKEDSKFLSNFEDISFSLRDLDHHVRYQILLWGLPIENEPEPTLKPLRILQHQSWWRNRQEVYVILHSLNSFLCRVTREFSLLRTRVAKDTSFAKAAKSPPLPA
ncbi:interleukin-27 subunit alpha isoform X1 [Lacerta agilis]|uniref:interleukin-27 subunit alpha isoform X1 n=1 Tax=Lacerta agilis TaxID=80427 RepID=UPI00141987C8|nr:interleukin-27 subunit alpha isoform X1 [Lacerta agilis]